MTAAALLRSQQQLLHRMFSFSLCAIVSNVAFVRCQCATLNVNEFHEVDVADDKIFLFIQVFHIIGRRDGLWIVCGLLNAADQYEQITDT